MQIEHNESEIGEIMKMKNLLKRLTLDISYS